MFHLCKLHLANVAVNCRRPLLSSVMFNVWIINVSRRLCQRHRISMISDFLAWQPYNCCFQTLATQKLASAIPFSNWNWGNKNQFMTKNCVNSRWRSRILERRDHGSFSKAKISLVHKRSVKVGLPVMVCFSTYNVAHWRYLQLKNPIFFSFGIVAWHSWWLTALNWQKLYQITPISRNRFFKVQTTSGQK